MRRYETTFIVNPQVDDATIDRQVNAVVDLIKNNGGQIMRETRWGTRRMAYAIAGLTQGFYASIVFDAENEVLPLLERHYQLEEPYIRYLTIRFEGSLEQPETTGQHEAFDSAEGPEGGPGGRGRREGGWRGNRPEAPRAPEPATEKNGDEEL